MRATFFYTLFELTKKPFEAESLNDGPRLLFEHVFRFLYVV